MNNKYNGDKTRRLILETAFLEVHRSGFRATSLNDILDKTKLTKGAFYHHFKNKLTLGYALVDELLNSIIREFWLKPLETCENPIDTQIKLIQSARSIDNVLFNGCPLNNLAVEMAPIDEGFRQRLNHIYDTWITVLAGSLARGQQNGYVRKDIDTRGTAIFIVASLAGCIGITKNSQSLEMFYACSHSLSCYLELLRT
ncbi:MAG: TetR/AcrR family transcriptional regulator [Candidatus Latescibacteria bacterium]|nr:TetR/AcrR family transcriptional regulator [Candidatus Latescibacterota bacterium]